MTNKSLSLKEHYNQPSDLQMNYMDHLVRGLSMQNTQKIDMLFTKTVSLLKLNICCTTFVIILIDKSCTFYFLIYYFYLIT